MRQRLPKHLLSAVAVLAFAAIWVGTASADGGGTRTVTYDDFSNPAASEPGLPAVLGGPCSIVTKWCYAYGPLESGVNDANHFRAIAGGSERMRAVPFTQSLDFSVFDHLKLMEVSTEAFPLPARGSLEFSADITAATPGVVDNLQQLGYFGPSFSWLDPSAPPGPLGYQATLLEGQQAGVVLNMVDFCTGQLFDWFLSNTKAFTLIERLPTNVTGNTTACPGATAVGKDLMYTQIANEVQLKPGKHTVAIKVTQNSSKFFVEYTLDGKVVTKISNIGIPLDKQGVPYTGIYPSLGPGESLKGQIQSFSIGHGLFSLLDAFPFQHPDAPELSVSVPLSERLFGQGATGTFDDFKVKTVNR